MITVRNLSLGYAGKKIIDNLSFTLHDGDFIYLTGKTGTGKTTLINALSGDIPVLEGDIIIDDTCLNDIPKAKRYQYKRQIGIVFQDYRLFPKKTVLENILYAGRLCVKDEEQLYKRAIRLLSLVGLQGKEDSFPSQLSGGEKQRVSIARALINDPVLILADEPTGNLDKDTTNGIFELFERINQTEGTSIILATHDIDAISRFPHPVLKINNI